VITAIVTVQGSVVILLRLKMFLLTLMLMLNEEEHRRGQCAFVGEKVSHPEGQE
jgi:hypothetical protein